MLIVRDPASPRNTGAAAVDSVATSLQKVDLNESRPERQPSVPSTPAGAGRQISVTSTPKGTERQHSVPSTPMGTVKLFADDPGSCFILLATVFYYTATRFCHTLFLKKIKT